MKRPKSHPKKQHYLPSCYLRGFTYETGYLHEYDLVLNRYFEHKPENIAKKRYLYDYTTSTGEWGTVETGVLDVLDGKFANSIQRLVNEELEGLPPTASSFDFDADIRSDLAYFVAAQVVRVPSMKKAKVEMLQQLYDTISDHIFADERQVARLHRMLQEDGEFRSLEEVREYLQGCRVNASDTAWIDLLLESIERLHYAFSHNCWEICVAGDADLITADRPVIYEDRHGVIVPPMTAGLEGAAHAKTFPLSSKACLRMFPDRRRREGWFRVETPVHRLTADEVLRFNANQAYFCERKLYGDETAIKAAIEAVQPDPENRPALVDTGGDLVRSLGAESIREYERDTMGRRRGRPRRRKGRRARKA